jgi:sigma-B regulation protein RsbU (phosphoserine phosphatase)
MTTSQNMLKAVTAELVMAQDQLLALYELSSIMGRQTNLESALRALAKLTCQTMSAEQCVITLNIAGRDNLKVVFPTSPDIPLDIIPSLDNQTVQDRWLIRANGQFKSGLLLLPIQFEDKMRGSIVCIRSSGQPFASPEGKLGQAIANLAAAFLENLILNQVRIEKAVLEEEMRIANQVQNSLLPTHLPIVEKLDLWAKSQSAKQVGGDFYDMQLSPQGDFYFCLGDVSGKGVSASLLMSMLLMIFRNELRSGRKMEPGSLLQHINQATYPEFTDSGKFATLFIGCFKPQNRLLRYANAGHSPVLFCDLEREPQLLEANNVPIGVLPDIQPEESEIPINAGHTLLVGSDGLNETRDSEGRLFGIDGLRQVLNDTKDLDAAAIGQGLFDTISNFGLGLPQSDDRTGLIIKGIL